MSRVHQLLELAGRSVNAGRFKNSQETAITGELVRVMDEIIDDPNSPRWVRHFSVHDDPPVNAPKRVGRSRKRLDIKVVSAQRFPRSRFSFEAKRLGYENPISKYLGDEGLGCFLSGDYGREQADAGMLGYVQSETPDVWAGRISTTIQQSAKELFVLTGHEWKQLSFRGGPAHTYHTRHKRPSVGRSVGVYHTLLECC